MNKLTAFNNLSFFHACLLLVKDYRSGKSLHAEAKKMAREQIDMEDSMGCHEYRESFHDLEDVPQAQSFFISIEKAEAGICPVDSSPVELDEKYAGVELNADNLYTAQCLLEDILMNNPDHIILNDPQSSSKLLAELLFEVSVAMDSGYDVVTNKINVVNEHCWDLEIVPRALEYLSKKNKSLISMGVYMWADLILKIIKECDRQVSGSLKSKEVLS